MVHQSNISKTPLVASERGAADELMDVGLRAGRQTDEIAAVVLRAAIPSSTSSVHQFNSKHSSDSQNEDSRLLKSGGPDGHRDGGVPLTGRTSPCKPHRPLSDLRTPDNTPHPTRAPDLLNPNQAVPCHRRPWGRSSGVSIGHMSLVQHEVQQSGFSVPVSDVPSPLLPDLGGEGVREKSGLITTYHPLQPHGGQQFALMLILGICLHSIP